MAYYQPPLMTTGDFWSASQHNKYFRDNFGEQAPFIYTAKGDILVGSAPRVASVLSLGSNDNAFTADGREAKAFKWGGGMMFCYTLSGGDAYYDSGDKSGSWWDIIFGAEVFSDFVVDHGGESNLYNPNIEVYDSASPRYGVLGFYIHTDVIATINVDYYVRYSNGDIAGVETRWGSKIGAVSGSYISTENHHMIYFLWDYTKSGKLSIKDTMATGQTVSSFIIYEDSKMFGWIL